MVDFNDTIKEQLIRIDERLAHIQSDQKFMKDAISDMKATVLNPDVGVIARIKTIESFIANFRWHLRFLYSAMAGGVIAGVIRFIIFK